MCFRSYNVPGSLRTFHTTLVFRKFSARHSASLVLIDPWTFNRCLLYYSLLCIIVSVSCVVCQYWSPVRSLSISNFVYCIGTHLHFKAVMILVTFISFLAFRHSSPFDSKHLSYGDWLEGRLSELFYAVLCTTIMHTHMSSSYRWLGLGLGLISYFSQLGLIGLC